MAEIREGSLSELIPDDKNMNRHTPYGMSLIEKSIRENGLGRSILVDKDNRIIGGNGVVETAAAVGMENTIVVETTGDKLVVVKRTDVSLDSKQGRSMAMADNATAAADLDWDAEAVQEVVDEWGIEPQDWGVVLDELDEEVNASEDDFNEETDNVEAVCNIGEIWQLGRHRLMCGDCTDAGNLSLLMCGHKADISFFSPPYNAGFGANLTKHNGRESKYTEYNDNKTQEEYTDFLQKVLDNACENSAYTFCNIQMLANNKHSIIDILSNNVNRLGDIMVWDKGHAQPAAAERVLNSVFEFVFVFHEKGNRAIGTKNFHGSLDNIVHVSPTKNEYSKVHNAVFPVEFASHFISNFASNSVLDVFGGTGTTMIAAEQLGKMCYMMELDPHYCDIIISRWEKLTGAKAVKINNNV